MECSDAVGFHPSGASRHAELVQYRRPVNTTELNEKVLKKIIERLHNDDIWKLQILLCSILDPEQVIAAENCGELFSKVQTAIPSSDDFNFAIVELLYTIKRYDLVKMTGNCKHRLKNYFNSHSRLMPHWKQYFEKENNVDDHAPKTLTLRELQQVRSENRALDKESHQQVPTENQDLNEETSQEVKIKNEDFKEEKPLTDASQQDWYPFTHSPCGYCVIINNEKFRGKFPSREGSTLDENALKDTFLNFDFEVDVKKDLTLLGMRRLFQDLKQKNYDPFDCFVCCILSHGDESVVYTSDEDSVSINEIVHLFTGDSCKTLNDKPKLFFIQACQGNESLASFTSNIVRDGPSGSKPSTPNISDYLLSMATIVGYYAFRDKRQGSWYVQKLVDALKEHGDKCGIDDILIRVNKEVAKFEHHGTTQDQKWKQMPIYSSTLRKKLRFRRKRQPEEN